ncbi:mas-related G-protein coupled receptor member H-like [Pituophis catenifer annectens]|uniref:mas-related G-protein coupled receptor member H-like n=1 Tax=Pituophis catenifer annectens TaxID=94852 RepID=UPI0039942F2A
MIVFSIILIVCCIGVPLNGIVIWLLGFQIKRNPFTVLILNLAIADFGFLLFMAILCINYFADFIPSGIPCVLFISISDSMYINGLLLLVAISIDRCVSVLFPIWHRCSRPKRLSPAVCAFLWICSVLLGGIPNIVEYEFEYNDKLYPHLLITNVLCIPMITISTVILLVKTVLKPKQKKRGRLLVMILMTLLCFLIFTVPLDIYLFIINVLDQNYFSQFPLLDKCFELGACLNSNVNPVIYFLVGRKKQTQSRESMKAIFQRAFREDEVSDAR